MLFIVFTSKIFVFPIFSSKQVNELRFKPNMAVTGRKYKIFFYFKLYFIGDKVYNALIVPLNSCLTVIDHGAIHSPVFFFLSRFLHPSRRLCKYWQLMYRYNGSLVFCPMCSWTCELRWELCQYF